MSLQYREYLKEHIENVGKAYEWLCENLPGMIYPFVNRAVMDAQIASHDFSKLLPTEYNPYYDYFYGNKKTKEIKDKFNYAWLNHIHTNPHHWQHWVLINDDPEEGTIALDMPYCYIIEMICDWWSFSWKSGNLREIFDWYKDNGPNMFLSEQTRRTVGDILQKISNKLKEMEENKLDGKEK